jgi:putative ABC transport system ATP-binding protein
MLQITELVKHYEVGDEPVCAVDGVSLRIELGELVALYGPSGSGKSTLIDLIAGFQAPDSGSVTVDGREVHRMANGEHADYLRLTIGIIGKPEDLMESASARENACLKLLRDHPKKAPQMIEPLLVALGLGDRLDQPVRKLSMGERQRVMIAQALANNPKLVLADEPTGTLDTRRSAEVLALIRDVCRERQAAVLLVTHDPRAVSYANVAYELRDGRLHDYEPEDLPLTAAERGGGR